MSEETGIRIAKAVEGIRFVLWIIAGWAGFVAGVLLGH